MKPMIIYSTPRSKSTAALEATKRQILLNEPFGMNIITGMQELRRVDRLNAMMNYQGWDDLVYRMSQPNTATKFFGSCIHHMPKARRWFKTIDETNSHDIFCLIRAPRDILMSHVIAQSFGYFYEAETEDTMVSITEGQLFFYHEQFFQQFLTYYPKNATTITFETLPEQHFDRNRIHMTEQKSIERRKHCIINLEEVEQTIDTILRFYQTEWEDKTKTSIFS